MNNEKRKKERRKKERKKEERKKERKERKKMKCNSAKNTLNWLLKTCITLQIISISIENLSVSTHTKSSTTVFKIDNNNCWEPNQQTRMIYKSYIIIIIIYNNKK